MVVGPPSRAIRALRRCAGWRIQVFKSVIAAVVLGSFLYHMSFNLQRHLERKTTFITSEAAHPPALFPNYRLCISPIWNPLGLLFLGLNISGPSYKDIAESYNRLSGISRQMSGRELVENAAWRVEDLIEEVRVGNIHEVYDSSTPSTSQLWRRSFTPLGPCLIFTPPESAILHAHNLSIKLRQQPASIEPCRWEEEGRVRQYEGPEDCLAAHDFCNISCEWQEFIVKLKIVPLHYLQSTADAISISGSRNILPQSGLLNGGKNVVVRPFRTIPLEENGPLDSEACYFSCLTSSEEKEANCTSLWETSLDKSLSSLCVTEKQLWYMSRHFLREYNLTRYCFKHCISSRAQTKWIQSTDTAYPDKNTFRIRLPRPVTVVLTENEIYPLSQFLADTGGALGLFLGVCALDGWNFLVRVVVSREVVARRLASRTLGHLGQLVGALVVSMATCVHLLIMGTSYLEQPVTLSASLTVSARYDSNVSTRVTPESLVMERMASRVLGCRVSSNSKLDECVKCMLQEAPGQSLPFISVDDLPSCTAEHLTFPRLTFTVPKTNIERIASKEILPSCLACSHLNDSRPTDSVHYSVDENSPYSANSMLCTLGGLLGLYLGVSLLNIQSLFHESVTKRRSDGGGRCRGVGWLCFTGCVVAAAVAICFLQLATFLGAHPVYSSTSTHSLQEGVLPSVTTCIWPPFNVRRLLETAGLGLAFTNVSLIPDPEERDAATALLLQDLPESSNVTDPHILWNAGAWVSDEVMAGDILVLRDVESFLVDSHQTSNGILNKCWRYTPNVSAPSWSRTTMYIQHTLPHVESLPLYNYFLSYFHYLEEGLLIQPNLFSNLITESYDRYDISAVTKWNALNVSPVGERRTCVSRCLEAALAMHLNCNLPLALESRDFDSCNMTVFASFLTTLWRLRTRPSEAFQNIVGQDWVSRCHAACCNGDEIFFRLKRNKETEDIVMAGLSVAVSKQNKSFQTFYYLTTGVLESMSVHDGYSVTMLLSDLGGILGMTLGVSLLSFLLSLVTKATQSRRMITKVSPQLPPH